jgi:hypothetical protein
MVKKLVFVEIKKAYGGVEIPIHSFLTLALDGQEWSALIHGHFTPPPIEREVGGLAAQSARALWKIENCPDNTDNRTRIPPLPIPQSDHSTD